VSIEAARWPSERDKVEDLRRRRVPRLLVVEPGADPPLPEDFLEDWVRPDTTDDEVEARRSGLEARARLYGALPEIDDDGLLRFRRRWVAVSPVEGALVRALVERYGSVVTRDTLAARAWPDGIPTRNALDVHMLRLRRRIAPLGLEIRTVRSRGYLLQELEDLETGA
jgi:two-component system OmpR family response regulator